MPTPKQTPMTVAAILERFPALFTDVIGETKIPVTGVNSPEAAGPGELTFLASAKALSLASKTNATTLVVSPRAKDQVSKAAVSKTVLISPNPEKAMALVISTFFRATPHTNPAIQSVHATAFIGENAKIAKSARVSANAFVGARVELGENVYIGANAVVEDDCVIGESTVIHPLAFIGHSTWIGARCEIHPQTVIGKEGFGYAHDEKFNHTRIPHQGRVVLEDDVHIGACCAIDRATFGETRICSGVIMDNLCHIAHNCTIGKNSVLTSGFTMAGSSKIGANFVTGGKTVVTGHIEVTDNVQVAALSAIAKSINEPGQYGGHPLQPLQQYIKTKAATAHLPQMRKSLKMILKHLGLNDGSEL